MPLTGPPGGLLGLRLNCKASQIPPTSDAVRVRPMRVHVPIFVCGSSTKLNLRSASHTGESLTKS